MSAARQLNSPFETYSPSSADSAIDSSDDLLKGQNYELKSLVYFVDDEPALRDIFQARFEDQFCIKTFASGFELISQL